MSRVHAGRICNHPTCGRLVFDASYCAEHTPPRRKSAPRSRREQPRYRADWREVSRAFLHVHPYCADPYALACTQRATQVDHIVPLRRGGVDQPTNYQALCASCHSRKTAFEDGGFGNASVG